MPPTNVQRALFSYFLCAFNVCRALAKQGERGDRIAKYYTYLDTDDTPILTLLDHLDVLPSRLGASVRRWSSRTTVGRYFAIHLDHHVVDTAPSV
jgi:hypothetical protein